MIKYPRLKKEACPIFCTTLSKQALSQNFDPLTAMQLKNRRSCGEAFSQLWLPFVFRLFGVGNSQSTSLSVKLTWVKSRWFRDRANWQKVHDWVGRQRCQPLCMVCQRPWKNASFVQSGIEACPLATLARHFYRVGLEREREREREREIFYNIVDICIYAHTAKSRFDRAWFLGISAKLFPNAVQIPPFFIS